MPPEIRKRKLYFFLLCFSILVLLLAAARYRILPDEPQYGGKKLSVWLDELAAMSYQKGADPTTTQAQAVRAIGTNAIPWLLRDLRKGAASGLEWRLNEILNNQRLINYRFPGQRLTLRAFRGFCALGPIAEPAIPQLLKCLNKPLAPVPETLSVIGNQAIPALQQCLTNTTSIRTSLGTIAPVPGNTIASIQNALGTGRLSNSAAAIFLPAIRQLAQSTNVYAAAYATNFLREWDH